MRKRPPQHLLTVAVVALLTVGVLYTLQRSRGLAVDGQNPVPSGPFVALPAEVDFGVLKNPDVRRSEMSLRNTGDKPLEIVRVATSCGCVGVRVLGDRNVAPDAAVPVEVVWQGDKAQPGLHVYEVAVIYRVPGEDEPSTFSFAAKYDYAPDYLPNPPLLYVDARDGGGEGRIVLLDLTADNSMRVVSAEASNADLKPETKDLFSEFGREGEKKVRHRVELKATIPQGWPLGKVEEEIVLRLNTPARPELRVPVRAVVQGPVRIKKRHDLDSQRRGRFAGGRIVRVSFDAPFEHSDAFEVQ